MKRFNALFERRIRGFRVVDLAGCALLVTLVLGVYAAKTDAGEEGATISSVERQIGEEQRLLRLLRAELAHLEEPRRLERLSAGIGLQPVAAARETPPDGLIEVARQTGAHHP
ncbi:MAG: cell division protein [Caulobacteraceae bacterium]